jgi:rod shape-determining protein MreD
VIVILVLQLSVMLDIRIGGVHPDLILGLAAVAGLVGGTERGALVGFASGVAIDLFLPTPFGLTALVGTIVGAATGMLATPRVDRFHPIFVSAVAALGSGIGVIMFAVLGTEVLNQPDMLNGHLSTAVIVVAVVNGILGYPLTWACRWALGREDSSTVWRGRLVSGDLP